MARRAKRKTKRKTRTMARRRSPRVSKSGGTTIVTMPASAPVARRSRRRSSGGGRRIARRHRRRSSGSSLGGSGGINRMVGYAVGGFAVGFIEKTFPNLPSIPIIGRKGTIAIAAHFLKGKHPIINDIGCAAAAISGYELGSSGHITGSIMGGGVASQM